MCLHEDEFANVSAGLTTYILTLLISVIMSNFNSCQSYQNLAGLAARYRPGGCLSQGEVPFSMPFSMMSLSSYRSYPSVRGKISEKSPSTILKVRSCPDLPTYMVLLTMSHLLSHPKLPLACLILVPLLKSFIYHLQNTQWTLLN